MQKYVLIGFPLDHSLSPKIHSFVNESNNIDASYSLFEIRPDDFTEKISILKQQNIGGFNITIPYKSKIIAHLNQIDSQAKIVGAVNTVKAIDGEWHGYNTDVEGFISPLKGWYDLLRNCLIVGNGGVARAAIFAVLKYINPEKLIIAGRNIRKVTILKNEFNNYFNNTIIEVYQINQIADLLNNQDLIINTTPLGMFPFINESPLSDSFSLKSGAIVYDLIYNPIQTKLLKDAKRNCVNCSIINGMEMLIAQALESIYIWTGKRISADYIYSQLISNQI